MLLVYTRDCDENTLDFSLLFLSFIDPFECSFNSVYPGLPHSPSGDKIFILVAEQSIYIV